MSFRRSSDDGARQLFRRWAEPESGAALNGAGTAPPATGSTPPAPAQRPKAAPEAARTAASSTTPAETVRETQDAELIVAVFRTAVLLVALLAPRLFWVDAVAVHDPGYEVHLVALGALAGAYNIAAAVACLFPHLRLRRPFIVVMDALLVTTWIKLSGQWGLFPFYYIVVVVAAMWFRVLGGALAAAFCNFFFLWLWGMAANGLFKGEDANVLPPVFEPSMAINVVLLFLVGCLVGFIAEAQEREREQHLESDLLVANYQREIDLATHLQPLLMDAQLFTDAPAPGAPASPALAEAPRPAIDARFEIGMVMKTARAIGGGDYFDIIALPEGRTGLCIADVAGKSARAQARLPLLKYSLRALAPLSPQPGQLISRLNETLSPDLQPELFIALCYVVLDPQRQRLSWCNAGHMAPFLIPSGTGTVSGTKNDAAPGALIPLDTDGPALGMFPDMLYDARSLPWRPGDQLLLFTDGLVDAFSWDASEDGEAQVRQLVARLTGDRTQPARAVTRQLIDLASAVLDETTPEPARPPFWVTALHPRSSRSTPRKLPGAESSHRDDITVVLVRFSEDRRQGTGDSEET